MKILQLNVGEQILGGVVQMKQELSISRSTNCHQKCLILKDFTELNWPGLSKCKRIHQHLGLAI